jgi:hypothetical protein
VAAIEPWHGAPGSTRTHPGNGYAQRRSPCGPTTTHLTLTPRPNPRTTPDGRLGHARPPTAGSDTHAALANTLALPRIGAPARARSPSSSPAAPLRRTRPIDSQHLRGHPCRSRRTTRPLVAATSCRDASSAIKTDLGVSRVARRAAGLLKRPQTALSTSEKELVKNLDDDGARWFSYIYASALSLYGSKPIPTPFPSFPLVRRARRALVFDRSSFRARRASPFSNPPPLTLEPFEFSLKRVRSSRFLAISTHRSA